MFVWSSSFCIVVPWGLQRLTFVWGLIEWKRLNFSMCRRWKKERWKGGIWQGAEEGLVHLGGDEQEPCLLQGWGHGLRWHWLGVLPALSVEYQQTTWVIPCMKPCAKLAGNFPLVQFFCKKSMLTKLPTGNCMFSLKMERYTVSRVTAIPLKQWSGNLWYWLGVWCN